MRKKLYNDNVTAKALGFESDNKIFVVESITGKNKDLVHEAYGVKRDKAYKFIWTSSGNHQKDRN